MSEKRYIIVSPSHHKKPRAMFLSEPADGSKSPQWNYHTTFALLLTKAQVNRICADTLVSFVTIEYSDDIKELARTGETKFIDYVNKVEEVRNTSRVFTADGLKVLIVNTMRKVRKELPTKPQTQAAPEAKPEPTPEQRCYALYSKSADGSIKYFCDEKDAIVVALHKGQRVQIFTQSEAHELQHLPYTDEANADVWNVENIGLWNLGEPQETPEEKREYVLYYSRSYEAGYRYYSSDGSETFDKLLAQVMTFAEANQKINELSVKGQYQWLHKKVKIKPAVEEETPSPEAKKRVVYVLRRPEGTGEAFYYCGKYPDLVISIGGKNVKAFRTQEEAEFAKDILDFDWVIDTVEVKIIK